MKKALIWILISITTSCGSVDSSYNKSEDSDTVIICVSRTSHKYHARKCQGVRSCTHELKEVSVEEAEDMGKSPCGFCY